MAKNKKGQEDKSKVKLYKTKHGWFSALTRFFKLFSFRSKKEVKATDFNDLDSLKNMHTSDTTDVYKKGAATVATLLGIGATGVANPTEAHAATTTVDQSSQVIGSGLTSTSTSTSNSTSTSQSKTSTSESTTSTSNINSGSISGSTSTSQSKTSTSESTTSTSNINSGSTSTSTSTASSQSASTSTSVISSSMSGSLANSDTSLSSNDDFETFTKENSNSTVLSVNQSLSLRTTTKNITNGTIALFNSSFIQTNKTEEKGTVNVSTADEFINAIKDSNISTIKLTANIDLGNSDIGDCKITPHNFTIDGSNGTGKYELNIGNNCIWLHNNTSTQYTTIIKSVKLYTANQRGGFAMTNPVLMTKGAEYTLIYDDVDATGGTAVFADTNAGLKVFEVRGNTTINGVNSYQYNGNTYTTEQSDVDGYQTLIYSGNDLKVDDGASLIINNSITPFDIAMLGNHIEHVVSVGNNANLTINNTYNYRGIWPWYYAANIALTKGTASFVAGENSNINLNTSGTNLYFLKGSNNTVTFNQGTNATLSGNRNFYFGNSNNTININDPAHLTLNTTTGTTFSTDYSVTVNANNTNVVVTNNGVTSDSNYFGNNQSTVNGTSYAIGATTGEQNNGNAPVQTVMADINQNGTTR
ncbi:serine-rich glycoprotein adhesin, partial [Limosilactobacillus balticus]